MDTSWISEPDGRTRLPPSTMKSRDESKGKKKSIVKIGLFNILKSFYYFQLLKVLQIRKEKFREVR